MVTVSLIHEGEEGEIWYRLDQFKNPYYISSFGRIKRMPYNILWRGKIKHLPEKVLSGNKRSVKGYVRVHLEGKGHQVHRLVCAFFHPNPNNKPQVNHKDGNKENNHPDNLEWCTNQENRDHAVQNKLIASRQSGFGKLDSEEVFCIKILYKRGINQPKLSSLFGVCQQTISKVLKE